MVVQSFGVPAKAATSMLGTIQDMKFFLRTGYGDSTDFVGGNQGDSIDTIKTQGIMQGNGGGPACWTVTTIPMLKAHKKKGHGAHLVAVISEKESHIAGSLFLDDTDLFHLDMRNNETKVVAHNKFQNSILNWGKLLSATGGALKPSKCSYYLISFKWDKEGVWSYEMNEGDEEWNIYTPLANGETGIIEHLSVDSAVKTLGSMTCPSGSNKAAIARECVASLSTIFVVFCIATIVSVGLDGLRHKILGPLERISKIINNLMNKDSEDVTINVSKPGEATQLDLAWYQLEAENAYPFHYRYRPW
jgi:hypothetical protein